MFSSKKNRYKSYKVHIFIYLQSQCSIMMYLKSILKNLVQKMFKTSKILQIVEYLFHKFLYFFLSNILKFQMDQQIHANMKRTKYYIRYKILLLICATIWCLNSCMTFKFQHQTLHLDFWWILRKVSIWKNSIWAHFWIIFWEAK